MEEIDRWGVQALRQSVADPKEGLLDTAKGVKPNVQPFVCSNVRPQLTPRVAGLNQDQ
ncbi:hypothetical protein MHY1_p00248 (plasmid) [Methylovirgula sp. HY1]|nr:hypothetical protein MHY1_p00248 [Methylovirgula sp. HY1]